MSLVLVWSQRASALGFGESLGEMCFRHAGPVFICLVDEAALPEELDDSTYRFIDPSVNEETLRCAQRTHELITSSARERRLAQLAEKARRRRLPIGRAFGGGALAGFTASVALLGAAGATAISAADQLTHEEAVSRAGDLAAATSVPALQAFPGAQEPEPWMELRPTPPSARDAAATRRKLDAVAARIAALQEADQRARLDRIAARAASPVEPGLTLVDAGDGANHGSHPLWAPSGTSFAATATTPGHAGAATEPVQPSAAPSVEEGASTLVDYSGSIGVVRRVAAIGPPRAEEIESF
jgi:hypothetical protein